MATSDWLRPFDFDRVFWSAPKQLNGGGEEDSASAWTSERTTQQTIYQVLGERIVEDVLNVSQALDDRQRRACVCPTVAAQSGDSTPPLWPRSRVFSWLR